MNELSRQDIRHHQAVALVLDAVTSPNTRRAYERALNEFIDWHSAQGRPALTKATVNSYKQFMIEQGRTNSVINQSLSAIRKLAREAADNGLLDDTLANGIKNVKGVEAETIPAGRSITSGELAAMLDVCEVDPKGIRDAAVIAVLYSCGLRRAELVGLDLADYDRATGELRVLHAKGNKQRIAHVTNGAQAALDDWLAIRGNEPGPLFGQVLKGGHVKLNRLTTQAVWHIVQIRAEQAGVDSISPHDFRRTFVGDLLDAGADISTVQKMAGHADISTTARYDRRPEEAKRKAAGLLHVPYKRRVSDRER